jgi:putative transcriptional regulator
VKKSHTNEIKKLGKRVRELREEKGITQSQLADECDVDIRTIQRVEKGEHGLGLHLLFRLAQAFDMSLPEFVSF